MTSPCNESTKLVLGVLLAAKGEALAVNEITRRLELCRQTVLARLKSLEASGKSAELKRGWVAVEYLGDRETMQQERDAVAMGAAILRGLG
jgi:predicted DNA-binding transcriptional regulator